MGYVIQTSKSGNFKANNILWTGEVGVVNGVEIPPFEPDRKVYWRVAAKLSNGGLSMWSKPWRFTWKP